MRAILLTMLACVGCGPMYKGIISDSGVLITIDKSEVKDGKLVTYFATIGASNKKRRKHYAAALVAA